MTNDISIEYEVYGKSLTPDNYAVEVGCGAWLEASIPREQSD